MSYKVYIEGYILIEDADGKYDAIVRAEELDQDYHRSRKSGPEFDIRVRSLEEICDDCRGEGVVATDEDDGEGHTMRGVGSEPCHCKSE